MTRRVDAERAFHLVGKVYQAAAQPALWLDALNAFGSAAGSEGVVLWLHDFADASARLDGPDISFACHTGFAPAFMASYSEHYTYVNPWMKRIEALPEGRCTHSSVILSPSQLHTTEYYADWLRPQGLGHALGGPVMKRGTVVAMFSLLRQERRGPYGDAEVGLLRMLMPHLRRALLLHQRLTGLHTKRSGEVAVLELLPTAVWLLDAAGRLLFANAAGRELDARRDGVWINRDGRPVADDSRLRERLSRVIGATIGCGGGADVLHDCALRVPRSRGQTPLHVMLYPLGGGALAAGAAAAMFIVDPSAATTPSAERLQANYRLTPAEGRVALALAQGTSLAEYADRHGVAVSTVRTHLKRVLAKTGTRRQAQLVGLIAGLSAAR